VAIAITLRTIPTELWVAAAFVPCVSVVLMAIQNLPTFWFPLRQAPGSKPEPFELLGHVLVHPLVKMAGYCAAAATTSAVSAGAYFSFGQSAIAALIAAWLALAAFGSGVVVLLAHVFDRFDVSSAAIAR